MPLPPVLDLRGQHRPDRLIEGEVLQKRIVRARKHHRRIEHVQNTPQSRPDNLPRCTALQIEQIAVRLRRGRQLSVDRHRSQRLQAPVHNAAVFHQSRSQQHFRQRLLFPCAFLRLVTFVLPLSVEQAVIPLLSVHVLAQPQVRAEGHDLPRLDPPRQQRPRIGLDQKSFRLKHQRLRLGWIVHIDPHIFQPQSFKNRKRRTLDFHLPAHQLAEGAFGHLAHAIGIGDRPIGPDDRAEGDKQHHHPEVPPQAALAHGREWPQTGVHRGFEVG